jgi:APA family basic amino acid/polyamine antiporter
MHDLAEMVNIGTLVAFIIVSAGVIVLRYKYPDMDRPFKTPWMPVVPILGILSCSYLIFSLPWVTHMRFIIWLVVGMVVYSFYSYRHSLCGRTSAP